MYNTNTWKKKFSCSEVEKDDLKKIGRDLEFIKLTTEIAKELGLRAIVAGGYAVDGSLGQITRPHNDIFDSSKVVIKDNKKKTEPHLFNTLPVQLEGIAFEAQNPKTELEDKMAKKAKGEKKRTEIDQDIHNLQLFFNHQSD